MNPGNVWTRDERAVGDDHETIRIGMKRLRNKLIGHMRPVEVAGVDTVHAGLHCLGRRAVATADGTPTGPSSRLALSAKKRAGGMTPTGPVAIVVNL